MVYSILTAGSPQPVVVVGVAAPVLVLVLPLSFLGGRDLWNSRATGLRGDDDDDVGEELLLLLPLESWRSHMVRGHDVRSSVMWAHTVWTRLVTRQPEVQVVVVLLWGAMVDIALGFLFYFLFSASAVHRPVSPNMNLSTTSERKARYMLNDLYVYMLELAVGTISESGYRNGRTEDLGVDCPFGYQQTCPGYGTGRREEVFMHGLGWHKAPRGRDLTVEDWDWVQETQWFSWSNKGNAFQCHAWFLSEVFDNPLFP